MTIPLEKMTQEQLANIVILAPCGGCQYEAAKLLIGRNQFRANLAGAWRIARRLLDYIPPKHTCGGHK